MKNVNTEINVTLVYFKSIFMSLITFVIIYIVISEKFIHSEYFLYIKKSLDISTKLLVYFIGINLTTIVIYAYDKFKAIVSIGMRTPELVLHFLELLGGSIGALASQRLFRHKRRKMSFYKITWIIVVIQTTFLSLPILVRLPHDLQIISFGLILLLLVGLYFLDIMMFFLSSAYSLVVVGGIGYIVYYILINL